MHYTKRWFSGDKDIYTSDSDSEDKQTNQVEDIEQNSEISKLEKRRTYRKESLKTADKE